MSDFFQRLAARALDQVESVEPRIPSRFAAPQGAGGFDEQALEQTIDNAGTETHHGSGDAMPHHASRTQSIDIDRPRGNHAENVSNAAVARSLQGQADTGPASVPSQAGPRVSWQPPASRAERQVHRVHPANAAVQLIAPSRGVRPTAQADSMQGDRHATGAVVIEPATSVRATSPVATTREGAVDDASERQARRPQRGRQDDGPAHSALSGPAFAQPARRERTGAEPEVELQPVIEVRIGRIEVHAAPRPAPAGAPMAAAPAMSLDDYLKLRNDGDRQ